MRHWPYEAIPTARLEWTDAGPRAPDYDDHYGAVLDRVGESRQNFVAANDLATRFAASDTVFVVGETGFGTGLNLLTTSALFLERAPVHAHLRFVSVEAHPLSLNDARRAGVGLPAALALMQQELVDHWLPALPGWHTRRLFDERVTLSVFHGEALAGLAQLPDHGVDAWLLDGFAPDRNPAMWRAPLLAALFRCTRPGGSFATFTAAGAVRRGLAQAGFEVRRHPAAPYKREALRGFRPGSTNRMRRIHRADDAPIAIVGAGLAGAATARELALHGRRCVVFEADRPAGAASANARAVVHPRANRARDATSLLWLAGFGLTRSWLPRAGAGRLEATGVLQLPRWPREARRLRLLVEEHAGTGVAMTWLDAEAASEICGVPLQCGGIHHPQGGWVDLPALVRQLLTHPLIELHADAPVTSLRPAADGWQLTARDHAACHRSVVLAAGLGNDVLAPPAPTSLLGGEALRGTFGATEPDCVLTGALGCVPGGVDATGAPRESWLGNTFERDRALAAASDAGRAALLARLDAFNRTHDSALRFEVRGSFHGTRVKLRDHRPLADMIAPGLWLNGAHGAAGLLTCPLAACTIVSRMLELPPALDHALTRAIGWRFDGPQPWPGATPAGRGPTDQSAG